MCWSTRNEHLSGSGELRRYSRRPCRCDQGIAGGERRGLRGLLRTHPEAVLRISLLEKKILSRRINGEPLTLWAPLILLSSGMGWAHRFAFFWENLFPGPEILKQVFPGSAESKVWRLYVKRVLQLIGMIKMS